MVDGKVSVPVGLKVKRAGEEDTWDIVCDGGSGGGNDAGDLARELGKLYAKLEDTCEEGETTLGLSAGVDAGLVSETTEVISRRLCRNMRSVSV